MNLVTGLIIGLCFTSIVAIYMSLEVKYLKHRIKIVWDEYKELRGEYGDPEKKNGLNINHDAVIAYYVEVK